jgi:hypothetical protein
MIPVATLGLLVASMPLVFAADAPDLVREAANGWTQAAVKQDKAALDRYLAGDLQYAHAGGQLQNKVQYIAAVTQGPPRYESFTFSDVTIRIYGKAAAFTAYCDVKLVGRDSFRVRTLQLYVENNGQWQMAAHQSTRLSGAGPRAR